MHCIWSHVHCLHILFHLDEHQSVWEYASCVCFGITVILFFCALGSNYNPGFYAEIASIFRNVYTKDNVKHSMCKQLVDTGEESFDPRVITFESLRDDPEAPWNSWTKYEFLKRPSMTNSLQPGSVRISKSLMFLLKVCSNLVDIQLTELYHLVQCVEHEVSAQQIGHKLFNEL